MTEIENLLSMLGLDKLSDEKQEKVKEILKKIIDKWRQGENSEAYSVMNGMMTQLNCDILDEAAQVEIKDKFMELLSREAGFSKKDFLWEYGGVFNNPTVHDIKETLAGDITGKDSNRQGDVYSKKIGTDGLTRRKPEKRKYDPDEEDVIDKLEKLKKLFQNRNRKSITLDMIKKVLTEEDEEQILSAKQYLTEALKMANVVSEDKVLNYYFNESSPLTSTFNHSAWSGFKYIRVNKTGLVLHSNTFLCQAGTKLTDEKKAELEGMGVKIYFSESLNEGTQNKNELIKALANLLEWAKGNRGAKNVNPYGVPEVKAALKVLGKIQGVNYLDVDTEKLSEDRLSEAFQANDSIMDDLSYSELLDTVYSNIENPDERSIMKEFDKLLTMKVKDAKFEMKRAVKQILKDTQE